MRDHSLRDWVHDLPRLARERRRHERTSNALAVGFFAGLLAATLIAGLYLRASEPDYSAPPIIEVMP